MSSDFLFENLSSPEVSDLDRSVPLILPLGEGYSLADIGELLGSPDMVGWLPAIPYGWQGSGVEVPAAILSSCIQNLLGNLAVDGFQDVHLLLPEGLDFPFCGQTLRANRSIPAGKIDLQQIDREKVILVPIGHTEQHALHLPLNVDTVCIEAVMQGTAARLPKKCACLPVFPYGVSAHRDSFAGTFNMGGRQFEDFFLAVATFLDGMGFKRIYFNSGHGGNVSFLVTVVKYAGERHPTSFIATTWLYLNGPEGAQSLEELRESKIGGMGHACELETSLMLCLRPELVHMDRVVDEIDFISSPSYYMDWNESGALVANPPWLDDTQTGAYGAGSLATAVKGQAWLQAAIQEKAGHVEEIIFQQEQRAKKRSRSRGRGKIRGY